MHCKKTAFKFICCIMAVVMAGFMMLSASADAVSDAKAELERLQQAQRETASKINSIKNDKSKQQDLADEYDKQIKNLQSQINVYNSSISKLDGQIADANEKITEKQEELEQVKFDFKRRLREICMSGNDTTGTAIVLLMNAKDFEDILTAAEYTKNMATYDAMLINEIVETVREITAEQEKLEKDRAELETMKSGLMTKKNEIDVQIYEAKKILASLNADQNKYQNYYNQLLEQEQKVQQEIQNATGQYNAVFDGNFMWPLPGKRADYVITSHFDANRIHPVYGYPRPHNGTDYSKSGIANQPIYAAAAGKVTVAKYNDGGYGYYVTVEHGKMNGKVYSTLYAHMTRYTVKVGDIVRKGQIIGYVGKTGAATGYHLHLEVRINGTPVNPIGYSTFK